MLVNVRWIISSTASHIFTHIFLFSVYLSQVNIQNNRTYLTSVQVSVTFKHLKVTPIHEKPLLSRDSTTYADQLFAKHKSLPWTHNTKDPSFQHMSKSIYLLE